MSDFNEVGTGIMDGMLLMQYENSPNLKEYILAYVEEANYLFEQTHEVLVGRFLENAVGVQLDVIGVILQQSRNVVIPKEWFGFQGATLATKMADELIPSEGGFFISEDINSYVLAPLEDEQYRRVLMLRGRSVSKKNWSINSLYESIEVLLGRVPRIFQISLTAAKKVGVLIGDISEEELQIINSFKHWFVPMTVSLDITVIEL